MPTRRRWIWIALGLAALAAAGWALLTTPGPGRDEIDPASRAELERVLRESGGPGAGGERRR